MSTGALSGLPEWSDIDIEEVRAFRRIAFDRQIRAGTVLSRAGKPTPGAWLIVGGEVELIAEAWEYGREIGRLTAGRWLNPGCLVDGGPAAWTAVATTEVQAWLLTPDGYRRMAETPNALARRALRQLIQATVEDGAQVGQLVAELQQAASQLARPLKQEELLRMGFARLVLGQPVVVAGAT